MKILVLAVSAVLALLPLDAHCASSAPPSLETTPRRVDPLALVDVFIRVCLFPRDAAESRAIVTEHGGTPLELPKSSRDLQRETEHYALDLGGVPVRTTFDMFGTCLVGVEAADTDKVVATFDAAMLTLDLPRTIKTDMPAAPAGTIERNIEIVHSPKDPYATRLVVASRPLPDQPAAMYLLHYFEPRTPTGD